MSEPDQDAYVELYVFEDKMKVTADFYSPRGAGLGLFSYQVYALLKEEGIAEECFCNDNIDEACGKCFLGKPDQRHIEVALGKDSREMIPPYYKLRRKFYEPLQQKEEEEKGGRIDYKDISPFMMVKEGERIARRIDAVQGENGITVMGKEIPFPKREVINFIPGENIEEREGMLFAQVSGIFQHDETTHTLSIDETLEVKGDVDYSTGHISFAGDLVIHGTIRDGFRVAAGGNIYCHSTVDASEILSRKDLYVKGGIIGRKDAHVRVLGRVEAAFIEYCTVESHAGVSVQKSIIDSSIYTLGLLNLGDNGTLVSGRVSSEKGLYALNLGREGSPPCQVNCGISFLANNQIEELKIQQKVLENKIKRLRRLPERPNNLSLKEKAESVMHTLEREIEKNIDDLYANPKAKIQVSGKVFPGTEISIMGASCLVSETLERVEFYYDEEEKQVRRAPLKKK